MARILRTIAMLFVFAAAFTSCGKSMMEEVYNTLPSTEKTPLGYIPVEEDIIIIVFDDDSEIEVEWQFRLTAQDTIKVGGNQPIEAAEELSKKAAEELSFAYNYGISNTVKANVIVDYVYNDKSYKLNCLEADMMTVSGSHSAIDSVESPYYELSETVYTLSFDGLELASATQVFVVEEGYVPPTEVRLELSVKHVAFQKMAEVDGAIAKVYCDNMLSVATVMSDSTRRDREEIPFVSMTIFNFMVPNPWQFDNDNFVGETFNFNEEGVATVYGTTVKYDSISSSIVGEVWYKGQNLASQIKVCPVEPQTIRFASASSAVVKLYHDDAADYAEATHATNITINGDEVEKVEWNTNHVSYRREATYSAGVATVTCDNIFSAVQIMESGNEMNAEEVSYNCQIKLNVLVSANMEVEDLATAIGRDFSFSGNVAAIGNGSVTVSLASSEVVGEVLYQGKNYAGEITPCTVRPWSIRLISATSAVVKVYNGNSSDYAEFVIPVNVTERRKLISTDDSYTHVAFRRNADVIGANIAVPCDNLATFVDNYSDNTTETANINYSVVNNFSYVVPTFVVNNMSNMLGQSFSFNNGTAVIEGKNVSIDFVRREVSAIMHNGKDYRANAPVCEVVPVSIIITSATTATIRFEDVDDSSDYSEAVITINIIEAEDLNGEVLGVWITDAYQGRTLTSTDLHVLTNNNGVYTVYSRPVNSVSWTATEISASNAMALMEAGKAPAWVWNGGSYEIGVLSYITANKASTGYVISYHSFGGVLMNILGDAEAALNGVPFAEPLKATGSQSENMWTISYGGFTWYFV